MTPVTFSWATAHVGSGVGVVMPLFCGLLALLQASFSLFIKLARDHGRPALRGQAGDPHLPGIAAVVDIEQVAKLQVAGWLAALAVQLDLAAIDSVRCQRTGFKEAGGP